MNRRDDRESRYGGSDPPPRPVVDRVEALGSKVPASGPPLSVPYPERSVAIAKVADGYLLVIGELRPAAADQLAQAWHLAFPDTRVLIMRGEHVLNLTGDEVPPDVKAWVDEQVAKA